MFKDYATSAVEVKYSKERIERQQRRRGMNFSILAGGAICVIAVEALDRMSWQLFATRSLEGWSLAIIGGTLIIFAAVELIRHWLWQDDDKIYESEIERLSNK